MVSINLEYYIHFPHCQALLPWFSYVRKQDATSRFRRLVAEAECPADETG